MENAELTLEDLISFTEDEEYTPSEVTEEEEIISSETSEEESVEDETEDEDEDEEDKTEEDPEEDSEDSVETDKTEEEDPRLDGLFNLLTEEGYLNLPEDFKFDGKPETFQQALELNKKRTLSEVSQIIYNSLDDESREFLRYKAAGGGTLKDFASKYLLDDSIEEQDISTVSNQRKAVEKYLSLTTKYSKDKIQKLIDNFHTSGELESEAEDAVKYLKTYISEQKTRELAELEEKQVEAKRMISEAIDTSTVIPEDRRTKVKAFALNEISRQDGIKTDLQRSLQYISANPSHLAVLADLIYDYTPQKGFDFSRWEKKGRSKEVSNFQSKLDAALNSTKSKLREGSSSKPRKDSKIDLSEIIQYFD